jgi:hypothetical protein
MSQKQSAHQRTSENLPAVLDQSELPALPKNYASFQIPNYSGLVTVDQEALSLIAEEDLKGYEAAADRFPFVSIRQKPKADSMTGEVLTDPGGFKISFKEFPDVDDVTGPLGLLVSIVADKTGRVYFRDPADQKPSCKSRDGITGIGTPGGACATCPLGQFLPSGERPKCTQQINLLCYDHTMKAAYILNLGPSALSVYDSFKRFIAAQVFNVGSKKYSLPLFFSVVRITTQYKREPQPHYVPKFTLIESNNAEMVGMMKELRKDAGTIIEAVYEATEQAGYDADHAATRTGTSDPGGELPPGVTPVDKQGRML